MSLWGWYQAGFTASLVMGMLSVLLGGSLPGQLWASLLVAAVMVPLRLERKCLPGWVGTLVGVGGLIWAGFILRNLGMEAAVLAAGVALLVITLARLITAANLKHDGQLLLLTLLLMFSGSVLHTEVSYGLVSLGYAVAMVWALVTRQLVVGAGMEAKRLGGIREEVTLNRRDIITGRFLVVVAALSLFIVFSTGVLFVTFPRMGLKNLGLFARAASTVPGSVSLQDRSWGETGSGAVVARIYGLNVSQFEEGLYLRGPVYDELLASGFQRGKFPIQNVDINITQKPDSGEFVYEVFSHPLGLPILPTLGPVQEAKVIYGGQANPSLKLKVTGVDPSSTLLVNRTPTGPIRYRVRGGIEKIGQYEPTRNKESGTSAPPGIDYFLKLPPNIDSRLAKKAIEVVQGKETPVARVEAIRRFLQDGFTYTLEQPNRDKPDPLAAFLFEDRRGHCEYFATAFAALLRGAGIASRVVGGYQGGLWDDESGVVVFNGKHAHVWVEWFEPGSGWWAVDATPLALQTPGYLSGLARFYEKMSRSWDEYVVEFGLREQFNLFTGVFISVRETSRKLSGWPLKLMVAFSLFAFAALFIWRYQDKIFKRTNTRDQLGYALELAIVRLSGRPVDVSISLREALVGLEPSHEILSKALELYEARRFGQYLIPKQELNEILKNLRAVRRA